MMVMCIFSVSPDKMRTNIENKIKKRTKKVEGERDF
jgi:hypothetical protein